MSSFTPEKLVEAIKNLFELNHYDCTGPHQIHGAEVDLIAKARNDPFAVPIYIEATIEHVDNDKYGKDVGKLAMVAELDRDAQRLIVSSAGFSLPVRERATKSRIRTLTYDELFKSFEKFDPYISNFLDAGTNEGGEVSSLNKVYEEPYFEDGAGKELATVYLTKWRDSKKPKQGWLIVTGEYGTGKTALTKVIQYRWLADHKANPALPVPFRLELRNFTRQFDARGLLHNFLDGNRLGHIPVEFVQSLIRSGRVVLLLDGYDEMAQYLNNRERRACLEALADLSSGGARGIITSRPNYFTETEELQVFEILYDSLKASSQYLALANDILEKERKIDSLLAQQFIDRFERSLKDLNPAQTEALISKVLMHDPRGRDVVLTILKKVFRSVEHGDSLSLSGKPVIISYLLDVVEGLKKAPEEAQPEQLSEWQIYSMILNQLMLRDLVRSPETSPTDRRRFLQKLAMYLSRKDSALIQEEQFKDLVSREFRKEIQRLPAGSRQQQIERLFADLRSSGTLTTAPDPRRTGWRFSHNSLREFLVVEHLVEGLRSGQVVAESVPISDAMRLFCASMPRSDRSALLELLATEWLKPENRRGCSQVLSLLWDAFQPLFAGDYSAARSLLNRTVGDPVALNGAELARISLSSHACPLTLVKGSFSGASLQGIDLSHAHLTGCDFSSAYLENVNFANATLDDSSFVGSMLFDCDFSGCDVRRSNFTGIRAEDISIVVETDDVDAFKGGIRRLDGEYAIGFLKYAGAATDPVPDFAVYCHNPKFPIVRKILEKLSEQTLRQRMGLEQRGGRRADVPFAKKLIQSLEEWGFITESKRRKDLVEVTDVGRERLTGYVRSGRLPAEVIRFLKDN